MIRLVIYARETFELDTYGDENIAITYNIDDITNVESKFGNYSKTFDLPATKKNNKFFQQLYDLQSDVSQFSTLKGHKCQLFSNDISIFEGLLYLNEIVKVETEIKYRVNLVGETIRFIDALGDATISDLDFTELSNELSLTNIENSASNDPTVTVTTVNPTGTTKDIYYSYIQNGGIIGSGAGNIHDHFPPMNIQMFVKLKNIVDKIFEFAGFDYQSGFLDNMLETIFMDTGLHDRRFRDDIGRAFTHIDASSSATISTEQIDHLFLSDEIKPFGGQGNINNTITTNFEFDVVQNITSSYEQIKFSIEPTQDPLYFNDNDTGNILTVTSSGATLTAPAVSFSAFMQMELHLFAEPGIQINVEIRETPSGGGSTTNTTFTRVVPALADTIFGDVGCDTNQNLVYHKIAINQAIALQPSSTMQFFIKTVGTGDLGGTDAFICRKEHTFQDYSNQGGIFTGAFNMSSGLFAQQSASGTIRYFYESDGLGSGANQTIKTNSSILDLRLTDAFFPNAFNPAQVSPNTQHNFLYIRPLSGTPFATQTRLHDNHGKVKLADIIKDLFKMFNLVSEQRGQKLFIEPFNDFMQTGTTKNWSTKVDSTEIVQNYEKVPSKITWKYNNDKDDSRLKKYEQETAQEYGSMTVNLPVDYIDEKVIKLDVFSAMVFEQNSSGLRYPTCYAENNGVFEPIKNAPRLIFKQPHKVVATVFSSTFSNFNTTHYRVGSHMKDYPDQMHSAKPDLNFGYTQNVFISTPYQHGANLYLSYWYDYIQQRFTNERVLVKAKVYLTETDILNFSFADTIIIDNQNYKIVKIEYNAGKKGLAKLEMLKQ